MDTSVTFFMYIKKRMNKTLSGQYFRKRDMPGVVWSSPLTFWTQNQEVIYFIVTVSASLDVYQTMGSQDIQPTISLMSGVVWYWPYDHRIDGYFSPLKRLPEH